MENSIERFNRKDLLAKFLKETNVIKWNKTYKILTNYYYDEDINNEDDVNWIVESFIEDKFFNLISEWKLDSSDIDSWKHDIEKFEVSEGNDTYIETNNTKLMNSYDIFCDWININEKNEMSICEVMQKWQFDWYLEMLESIKEYFIDFLEEEIEKSWKKTISIKVNYILDDEADKLESKILEVNEIDYNEWKEIWEEAIGDELVEIITNETWFCVSELWYELI